MTKINRSAINAYELQNNKVVVQIEHRTPRCLIGAKAACHSAENHAKVAIMSIIQ